MHPSQTLETIKSKATELSLAMKLYGAVQTPELDTANLHINRAYGEMYLASRATMGQLPENVPNCNFNSADVLELQDRLTLLETTDPKVNELLAEIEDSLTKLRKLISGVK
jgi:hypothetical protein